MMRWHDTGKYLPLFYFHHLRPHCQWVNFKLSKFSFVMYLNINTTFQDEFYTANLEVLKNGD